MATGRSLHIGLNSVDPGAYGGWSGTLTACEFDAHDMRDICAGRGFQTTEILTAQATADAVLGALDEAAAGLVERGPVRGVLLRARWAASRHRG